jgi:hypothetical protein
MKEYRKVQFKVHEFSIDEILETLKNNYKSVFPESCLEMKWNNGIICFSPPEGIRINDSFEIYFSGWYSDFEEESFVVNNGHNFSSSLGIKINIQPFQANKEIQIIDCICFEKNIEIYFLRLIELLISTLKNKRQVNNLNPFDDQYYKQLQSWKKNAIILWRDGKNATEIEGQTRMAQSTIYNIISEARKKMGEEFIPRRKKSKKK